LRSGLKCKKEKGDEKKMKMGIIMKQNLETVGAVHTHTHTHRWFMLKRKRKYYCKY